MLDQKGVALLTTLVGQVEASSECRLLVLEGQGDSFCHGMDLALAAQLPAEQLSQHIQEFSNCLLRLRRSGKVVIAAVDGAVVGGGVGLVAVADLVLATQRSTFGLPELALGLLPGAILPALLCRLSPQRVRLLALSPGVDAAEARHLGLVDRIAPDGETLERQLRAAIKQVLRSAPEGVAQFKALCAEVAQLPQGEAFDLGWRRAAEILTATPRMEAVRAYLDGELPPWFERYRPRGNDHGLPGGIDDAR